MEPDRPDELLAQLQTAQRRLKGAARGSEDYDASVARVVDLSERFLSRVGNGRPNGSRPPSRRDPA